MCRLAYAACGWVKRNDVVEVVFDKAAEPLLGVSLKGGAR